jgi:hypothetical protein
VRLREKARTVWALYRFVIIAGAVGVLLVMLTSTGHTMIAGVLVVGIWYASLAYSYMYGRKAAKVLRGDLRRRQMSAIRVITVSQLLGALALSVGIVFARKGGSLGPVGIAIGCLLGLTPGAAFVIGQRLAARRLHTPHLILWLRRFHGGPIRGISFPTVLGSACSGLAIPLTLQDDRYAFSFQAGHYRTLRFLEIVGPIIVFTAILMSLFYLAEVFSPVGRVGATLISFFFTGVAFFVWMVRRQRSLGVLPLASTNPDGQIRALLDSLREDKKRVPGIGGLIVIKVPDECWRQAVLVALDRCALVIIDVTDLSDSLKWELSASVKAQPSERIILACGIDEMGDESERRKSIQQTITEIVGPEVAARLDVFFYPEMLGKSRLFVPQTNFALALQSILRDRLPDSTSAPGR